MDELLEEQREEAMRSFGTFGCAGWVAACVYLGWSGAAAAAGLLFFGYAVAGMFVGAIIGGALAYGGSRLILWLGAGIPFLRAAGCVLSILAFGAPAAASIVVYQALFR